WHEHPKPTFHVESRQSLSDGWQLAKRPHAAPWASGSDGVDTIGLEVREGNVGTKEDQIDLSAYEIVQRVPAALVRDDVDVDPTLDLQQLARQLQHWRTASAGYRSRPCSRRRQYFGHGLGREIAIDKQDERCPHELRNRFQVGQRIDTEL